MIYIYIYIYIYINIMNNPLSFISRILAICFISTDVYRLEKEQFAQTYCLLSFIIKTESQTPQTHIWLPHSSLIFYITNDKWTQIYWQMNKETWVYTDKEKIYIYTFQWHHKSGLSSQVTGNLTLSRVERPIQTEKWSSLIVRILTTSATSTCFDYSSLNGH